MNDAERKARNASHLRTMRNAAIRWLNAEREAERAGELNHILDDKALDLAPLYEERLTEEAQRSSEEASKLAKMASNAFMALQDNARLAENEAIAAWRSWVVGCVSDEPELL